MDEVHKAADTLNLDEFLSLSNRDVRKPAVAASKQIKTKQQNDLNVNAYVWCY